MPHTKKSCLLQEGQATPFLVASGGIDSWGSDVEEPYHIPGFKDIEYFFVIKSCEKTILVIHPPLIIALMGSFLILSAQRFFSRFG